MPVHWDTPERDDSLLTEAHRKFLLDEEHRESLSDSYRSVLRTRIRRRVQNGILDIKILAHTLSDERLKEIFLGGFEVRYPDDELQRQETQRTSPGERMRGLSIETGGLVALPYRAGLALDRETTPPSKDAIEKQLLERRGFTGPHAQANEFLADIIRIGMKTALEVDGEHGDPQINIELEDFQAIDDLADTALADVSRTGLQALLHHDEITPEEFSEEIQRRGAEREQNSDGTSGGD